MCVLVVILSLAQHFTNLTCGAVRIFFKGGKPQRRQVSIMGQMTWIYARKHMGKSFSDVII